MPRVFQNLRRFKPDVVQGWMYHGNLVATSVSPLCGARLFWGIRQALGAPERERSTTNRLIRFSTRLSSWPERIVYNSERARIDHEAIGYPTHNGLVIANGFDTEALRPDGDARSRLRQQLRLSEDTILIGHMARYHPVKDHATFLEAASELCDRGLRFHFVMTGRGVDSSNPSLVSAVARLGLKERVDLLGEADDVRTLLPGLDMLCVSSRSEAFPNVIGEAMSCGIACVTTDVGDAAQIVGETGQVVPPGKPHELADALYALAQLDPDERVRRGLAARQRIDEKYSLRSMIDRYLHLYSGSLRRD